MSCGSELEPYWQRPSDKVKNVPQVGKFTVIVACSIVNTANTACKGCLHVDSKPGFWHQIIVYL